MYALPACAAEFDFRASALANAPALAIMDGGAYGGEDSEVGEDGKGWGELERLGKARVGGTLPNLSPTLPNLPPPRQPSPTFPTPTLAPQP